MSSQPYLRYGSTGPSVVKLQNQLNSAPSQSGRTLSPDGIFGPKTHARVKEFQVQGTPRLTADGIVGPLTWGKLEALQRPGPGGVDIEAIAGQIRSQGKSLMGFPAVSRFALSANQKKVKKHPRMIVVTEQNSPWLAWAKQFQLWPTAGKVEIPNGSSLAMAATKLETAARMAGSGGLILLSVGHGGSASTGFGPTDEGFFDLAPKGFRIAGNNAILTGDHNPKGKKIAQVSAYYDRVPTFGGTVIPKSRKQEDEQRKNKNKNAKTRLADFDRYMRVGKTIGSHNVAAILLLTCKVGKSTDFLKRVRKQLQAPIAAYKRRVMGQHVASGLTRLFLEGDKPGQGTNIPMGAFWFPMPPLADWTVIM